MSDAKAALVLGATGGVGGETAAALLRHGWTVVAMARDPARRPQAMADALAGATWMRGDAMKADDVLRAAEGVQAIIHAVNPPGYRDWGNLVLPMIDHSIAAAKATGARVVLPGTIYNYGYDAFPELVEDSLQHPVTEKGRIRVELERTLEAGSREGAPALIVRFADFFGPAPGNNWYSQGLVTPGQRLGAITYPGRRGVGHAWAYLPDLGETMAELVEKTPAQGFELYHFAGHYDADGEAMIGAIRKAAGRKLPVSAFPWPLVTLLSPFVRVFRELLEMRYLWQAPLRLDNAKLVGVLGREPHTPLDEAVGATLRQLKCL